MDDLTYARLLYLLRELKITLPKNVIAYIPGGNWLQGLRSLVDPRHPQSTQQAVRLYEMGKKLGPPSVEEFSSLIINILEAHGALSGSQWVDISRTLASLSTQPLLAEEAIYSLGDLEPGSAIPTRPTGLMPVDAVLGGGLTAGIYLFIGAPGSGKTSLMAMLAEALAITLPPTSPLVYIQTEMPAEVFRFRVTPILRRKHFRVSDTLICAPWGSDQVLRYLRERPNPETVVIYDSPDPILLAGEAANVRFSIAKAWLDFIMIKQGLARSIIVTSWTRRGTNGNMNLESAAEGAAKERFSDAVIGISPEDGGTVRLDCFKNRLGEPGLRFSFRPDWANLTIRGQ
jgi:hypothetical protein